MKKESRFKFGDIVTFNNKLIRLQTNKGRIRKWIEVESKKKAGILIGFRTLSNGIYNIDTDYETNWTNKYYIPDEFIKVGLISTDMKSNPIYVLISDLR